MILEVVHRQAQRVDPGDIGQALDHYVLVDIGVLDPADVGLVVIELEYLLPALSSAPISATGSG
jgi:hypothetical protein